ncbi:MAG TPA: amidohydrolase family protein [Anaerolineae bacterium]|nr:amidohydrolase family protein [Anaerolineae bacterium]
MKTTLDLDQDIKITKVDAAFTPVQDQDLALYGDQLSNVTIVDVDVHVDDTLMNMKEYMEGHYRKRLDAMLQADFRGEPGNSLRNMIAHVHWLGSAYDKPPRAKLATKTELMERMEKGIINYSILFPSELLPIAYLPDPKWATALASTYNQYMVDAYSNLKGVKIALVVAPQMPERAAKEIERYASNKDVVCVCVPDVGVNPPIGDQKYWAIYEAAEANNLPIVFHGIEALVHDNYPLRVAHFPTLMQVHSMGFPFTAMLQVMSVVCEGVPVRFPKIKFAVVEAGLTWIPFIMYRLDTAYRQYRTELPALERKPSDYIREWYWGTHELEALPKTGDLRKLIELYQGEDTTMWASDWPHLERDLIAGFMRYDLNEKQRRKILGENAVRFFDLENKP